MSIAEKLQSKAPRRSGSNKQVRLRLVHIDFWSAMKVAAILGLVLGVVQLVVVFVMWTLLQVVGLFDKVDEVLRDILANPDFAALGRAFGAWAATVETTAEFGPALDEAMGRKGIRLLHLKTDVEVITNQTTISALRDKARV